METFLWTAGSTTWAQARERGEEPDQINTTGRNSSPAYYFERYDEGSEEGLRWGQIITVGNPGWECCKCLMVDVYVIWLNGLRKWWNEGCFLQHSTALEPVALVSVLEVKFIHLCSKCVMCLTKARMPSPKSGILFYPNQESQILV